MDKGKERGKSALDTALSYFSEDVANGVRRCIAERRINSNAVAEIRLRAYGTSALVVRGNNVPIDIRSDPKVVQEVFARISRGALFTHRDDISRGFISLEGGIRVGVCGHARYEGGRIVGIGEISSLAFRLPTGECSFAEALYSEWMVSGGGMLICSAAGEGKTSAIRALIGLIGSGERPYRVVAVDERCELDVGRYSGAHVDILRGYRRAIGVDIAIRTMSAEVLVVDEISSAEDAEAMLAALGAGVTVIATVHARSLKDAMRREYVRRLILGGLFESVCIIGRDDGRFCYRLEKIELSRLKNSHGMGVI